MREIKQLNIKELLDMNLTDEQIKYLIKVEDEKHFFKNQIRHNSHYGAPNSLFFLDIKDTLYHSKGHGGDGVLGRAGDSLPINMQDILALGALLDRTNGQAFRMDLYNISEDSNVKIEYDFPENIKDCKYKLDLPKKQIPDFFTGQTISLSDKGPYKVVFVSTDDVKTQKNIILFLLIIYKMYTSGAIKFWIDSNNILQLEKIFYQSNCDYDTFIDNLPLEYSRTLDKEYSKNDIENIINNITFLSTKESKLTKRELMKNFLDSYNMENGLTYNDYNIFACGDDHFHDAPMVKLAFELGGYGCLTHLGFTYSNYSETLRYELFNDCQINSSLPIAAYGFNDFYNKVIDYNSLQRTWDLAETMRDVNDKNKSYVLNRFKKTNHYITIKK